MDSVMAKYSEYHNRFIVAQLKELLGDVLPEKFDPNLGTIGELEFIHSELKKQDMGMSALKVKKDLFNEEIYFVVTSMGCFFRAMKLITYIGVQTDDMFLKVECVKVGEDEWERVEAERGTSSDE